MLLQDIFKRFAIDWMTVHLRCSFVPTPSRPHCPPRPSYPLLDQRAPLALSGCASVGEWLRAIKMERYEDSFLQAGLSTVDQLAPISTQSVPASRTVSLRERVIIYASSFFRSFQGSSAHGSDSGRTPAENPFQHPDHDLSEQEHHHCDLLTRLSPHLDPITSTHIRESALHPRPNTDSTRERLHDRKKL